MHSDLIRPSSDRLALNQCRSIVVSSQYFETRLRRPNQAKPNLLNKTRDGKLNNTERRHRILMLASKGLDTEGIASTLEMMPGEVELILNLNRQTPAYI